MTRERTLEAVLLGALILFAFLVGVSKLSDYDTFYHLAMGKYIVETGKITHAVDPFAFTPVKQMTTISWLSGVLFFGVHGVAGLGGLILFKALIVAALCLVLYLNMRLVSGDEPRNILIILAVLLVTVFAIRMRLFVRPHIFEFLLIPLFFYILNLHRLKEKNYLYVLPLLQLLWVNLHPSNILGMAVVWAFFAGEGFKHLLGRGPSLGRRGVKALAVTALAVTAVSVINPAGYKIYLFPFMLTGQETYMRNIGEWQALTLSHLTGYSLRYTWGFSVLLLSSIAIFLYRRGRSDLTDLIIFCLFFYQALKGVRLTAEFSLAVAPMVAGGWSEISRRIFPKRSGGGNRLPVAVAVLLALAVLFHSTVLKSGTYAFGLGLKERVFPVTAVEFLVENDIRGRMYNSIGYGGYLAWNLFPAHKVFIDGRNDVYGEELYREYLDAHSDPDVWERLVQRYALDWVILEYSRDYGGKERMPHLQANPEWALIYWDRVAVVYARRNSVNEGIIKKFEYRYARPNEMNPAYLGRYLPDHDKTMGALAELKRNLSINPDNEEARLSLAFLYYGLGRPEEELKEMLKVVEINPRLAFAHSALGELYMQRGDREKAGEEFERALGIDPGDRVALGGMERLEHGRGGQ
ncbi:MAG: tetratricopeptide repeat protein [Thermodesulfobacteriota bacterium]